MRITPLIVAVCAAFFMSAPAFAECEPPVMPQAVASEYIAGNSMSGTYDMNPENLKIVHDYYLATDPDTPKDISRIIVFYGLNDALLVFKDTSGCFYIPRLWNVGEFNQHLRAIFGVGA